MGLFALGIYALPGDSDCCLLVILVLLCIFNYVERKPDYFIVDLITTFHSPPIKGAGRKMDRVLVFYKLYSFQILTKVFTDFAFFLSFISLTTSFINMRKSLDSK